MSCQDTSLSPSGLPRSCPPSTAVGAAVADVAGITVADAAELAAVYADRLLVCTVRGVHEAIARRVLAATRQSHTPVGQLYNGITGAVYGGISLATRSFGHVNRLDPQRHRMVTQRLPFLTGDVEAAARGRRLRSVVNGLIGDVLHDQASPIAIGWSLRHPERRGVDIPLTRGTLAAAYPDARTRLVVFVHGLCEDDESWNYRPDVRGPSYLHRTQAGGRWTALAVRYNSGLPVRQNGRALAGLIDRLVAAWPNAVQEIALVGHSMGGLVVRAAAASAQQRGWARRVSHVALLGSPHGGAGLERVVGRAVPAMRRLPEVAPFASILEERSLGIRDLRDGIGVDSVLWPQAAYHCVGATLGAGERAWAGRMFGDLLVTLDSARGTRAEVPADFRQVSAAHHFDLLNHPEIGADLDRWLGSPVSHMQADGRDVATRATTAATVTAGG